MKFFITAFVIVVVLVAGIVGFFVVRSVNRFKPAMPKDIIALKGIEYAKHDGTPLRLDLYRPKGDGPFPVILWFHSGAWKTLDRSCVEQAVIDQTGRGYAVVSADYSLSPSATWPVQLDQGKTAVRWIRSHAKEFSLHQGKVIAWGMSSGGHLAAMLGSTGGGETDGSYANAAGGESAAVQAVVAWCAPVDLSRLSGTALRAAKALFGCRGGVPDDVAKKANPVTYVTPACPPFFIVHGDRDAVVPAGHSEELYGALKGAGVRATLKIYKGYAHTDRRFNAKENLAELEAFLDSL